MPRLKKVGEIHDNPKEQTMVVVSFDEWMNKNGKTYRDPKSVKEALELLIKEYKKAPEFVMEVKGQRYIFI